jgi:signal transduction histidine kinase/ligand-binding sensor domain-containing protein/CheY-like chemotaxis protein/AraC-like DNA-binding protein
VKDITSILLHLKREVAIMKLHCLLIYFLFFIHRAFAGDPVSVKYLGIEHGLSNNAITCIYQDHNGFMWFGTYDGLNKYDGYSFRIFRNIIGDSTSLIDNHIFSIAGDVNNNIWVGGMKGVSIYNPAKSVFYSPGYRRKNSSSVISLRDEAHIIKRVGNMMFVGTSAKGLIIFSNDRHAGRIVEFPELKGKEETYDVPCMQYDSVRNNFWLFVNGVGLCRYDFAKGKVVKVASDLAQANCIFVRKNGDLLIGNDNGLFGFNRQSLVFTSNITTSKIRITDVVEDAQNTLWITSDGNGLWLMLASKAHPEPYVALPGAVINSNAIYAIYQDADGRKWIGTLRGGVNIMEAKNNSFKKISYNNGQGNVINDFILSFCEDDKSNVWIGTDGAGLRYWNRANNSFAEYVHNAAVASSVSSNFITNITRDYQNDIWISTWFGGINKLLKSSHTFKHYTCYNPFKKQEENNVWLVYEDKQKRLWASTTNNGCLYTYNRAADRFEIFDETIINFQSFAEDAQGNLWGGNYTSLVLIDVLKKKHKTYYIGNPVRCIREDAHNNFWIGTEGGGLLLFDKKKGSYERLTTKDGLPSNTILRILEDKKGNIWLSTYNGLCRFNPAIKTYRNFSQSDGLQSNQFSFNAALALKSGEFLFGGIKGFNIFFPDSVYDKKSVPMLFLTGLRVNNTPIEEDDSYVREKANDKIIAITTPFDKAVLSLDFIALEYSGVDKMKYAYYLKGWDKSWNLVNNSRTANYSRLQEGSYTFMVKVMNADGVWSDETTLLLIKVLPPWYRTWWAYLLYILSLGGMVYTYLLYYKRQERLRYEVKLAQLDKEKEIELTEKKIAFFTHISHEFRTPLTLIINPLKELVSDKTNEAIHKKMMMIQRNAKRLLSLVDQLLLFRKVESIDQHLRLEKFDLTEACNEVFLSFIQHAASKNIAFSFHKPDAETWMYGDKEKIEIILFNLLSNAIKYTSSGGNILLEIRDHEKQVEIIVKDSGSGIPADVGNKLFESFYQAHNTDKASQTGFGIGLYVSQKLAKAHSGKLSYSSELGKGTTFTLTLLKGKEHFALEPISEDPKINQTILQELVEEPEEMEINMDDLKENKSKIIDKITSGLPTMVIVDDNAELRHYIKEVFKNKFTIYEADDGTTAYTIVKKEIPDIVISDVMMKKMGGIELCKKIKENATLAHIPVILLTASSSEEAKLKGIEGGAEDYITKPFDKEIIVARVENILKGRNRLQQYFFNTVTLKPAVGVEEDDKIFIERCIIIIERNLDNPDFTIQTFCKEIGMSHPSLYKKIKAVSGLTVNVFIRYLRLRKAAELLINTNKTIVEVTYITGFSDIKYFREQFYKLFEMNPSDYVKKYRNPLGNKMGSV